MKQEEKTLFITVAVAIFLIWFFKPKGGFGLKSPEAEIGKYEEPQIAMNGVNENKENAVTSITAMREAINDNLSKRDLDNLKEMITQDYGLKIAINKGTGKLRAMSKEGKVLAEEK
jgi:hypothetical protein